MNGVRCTGFNRPSEIAMKRTLDDVQKAKNRAVRIVPHVTTMAKEERRQEQEVVYENERRFQRIKRLLGTRRTLSSVR